MHLLFGAGSRGGAEAGGTGPPAPHTSLTSPWDPGRVLQRGRQDPWCWDPAAAKRGFGCWGSGGAPRLFQGGFGVREPGYLASPRASPQPSLPRRLGGFTAFSSRACWKPKSARSPSPAAPRPRSAGLEQPAAP